MLQFHGAVSFFMQLKISPKTRFKKKNVYYNASFPRKNPARSPPVTRYPVVSPTPRFPTSARSERTRTMSAARPLASVVTFVKSVSMRSISCEGRVGVGLLEKNDVLCVGNRIKKKNIYIYIYPQKKNGRKKRDL